MLSTHSAAALFGWMQQKKYVAFSLLLHVVVVGVVGGLWILESVGIWQLGRQAGRPH